MTSEARIVDITLGADYEAHVVEFSPFTGGDGDEPSLDFSNALNSQYFFLLFAW